MRITGAGLKFWYCGLLLATVSLLAASEAVIPTPRFLEPLDAQIRIRGPFKDTSRTAVSAGAKILIVPVENSPAPMRGGVTPDSGRQRRADTCLDNFRQ